MRKGNRIFIPKHGAVSQKTGDNLKTEIIEETIIRFSKI
jgi:hypothetical protein